MLHLVKRHPIAIRADFEFVLALTYAVPAQSLADFTPPGLRLDEWRGLGFLAAAFVQTRHLRPAAMPSFLGQRIFFSGYRVFSRYRRRDGRSLRGLRILRSDTDRRSMVVMGNLLTRYSYRWARVEIERNARSLRLNVATADGKGDVRLDADLSLPDGFIPEGSPFADEKEARRFAGPMPYTFEYEPETHSIIRIQGVRKQWRPRLVPVAVDKLGFLEQAAFADARPVLASCFYLEDVDYLWRRGVRGPVAW